MENYSAGQWSAWINRKAKISTSRKSVRAILDFRMKTDGNKDLEENDVHRKKRRK